MKCFLLTTPEHVLSKNQISDDQLKFNERYLAQATENLFILTPVVSAIN